MALHIVESFIALIISAYEMLFLIRILFSYLHARLEALARVQMTTEQPDIVL